MAVCDGKAGMVLNGEKQLSRRFFEPAFEEISKTHQGHGRTHRLTRAQPQRGLRMLYGDIMLTREYPEKAADKPTAGVSRVECQRAIDQPHHRADVLAEGSQH